MNKEETGKGIALFVFGAAVGAALGVLFAPKSGKETREDISDWLDERREKGSEILKKLKEEIPVKKDQIVAAVKAGKQAYNDVGNSHKETVNA